MRNVPTITIDTEKKCADCRAEIDRLRNALYEITFDGPIWRAQRIAREALAKPS